MGLADAVPRFNEVWIHVGRPLVSFVSLKETQRPIRKFLEGEPAKMQLKTQ